MSPLRRLRNFSIPWDAMVVLGCFSDAVAQTSYRVTDLGTEGNDILGCAMSLNNEGYTEVMAQNLPPGQQDSLLGTLLNGRLFLDIDGFKLDLGTLGGMNSSSNWGEINDFGLIVGDSVPAVCCLKGQGRRLCGKTWVTSNIDVTQNVYGKSWWEERADTFPARCTRQPSCGRLSKRGPPAQTSTVGQFPVSDRLNPDELSRRY